MISEIAAVLLLHLLGDAVEDRGELYHVVNPPGLEKLHRGVPAFLDERAWR